MIKKAGLKTAGISMDGYQSKPKPIDRQSPPPMVVRGPDEPRRPFTGIGLNTITAHASHELAAAREKLASFNGVTVIRALDPKRIQRSAFANRIEAEFSTDEFRQLKDEIAHAGGNVQPIKVRPVVAGKDRVIDGQSVDHEIVFGHRRHQACLELGIAVNAIVDEQVTDLQLFEAMDRENRGRKNLSAWEQGCMYREALDKGLYPSERRLAESLGANQSDVNRAIKLARLPKEVVSAFASPLDLQVRWQKPLTDALQRDPDGVLSRARALTKERGGMTAAQVLNHLVAIAPSSATGTDLVVSGKVVGSVRVGPKGSTLIELVSGVVSDSARAGLVTALQTYLAKRP